MGPPDGAARVGCDDRPRGDLRDERRRHLHVPGRPTNRAPLRRAGADRRAGDHLPRDRRARSAGPEARDARRKRPGDGELDRAGDAPDRRVGDRLLLADRREPGRDPARLERGHPRVPLGREGDGQADDLLRAGRLRRDRETSRDRDRIARRRWSESRQPALGRGGPPHPHRQPDRGGEGREPGLPRVPRERLQRDARARAAHVGGDPGVGRCAPARAGTFARAVIAAASIRSCAR